MGKGQNNITGEAAACRVLLIALLFVLAEADSYWHVISGDELWDFSLGKRLGFRSLPRWRAFQHRAKLGKFVAKKNMDGLQWEVDRTAWAKLIDEAAATDEAVTESFEVRELIQLGYTQLDLDHTVDGNKYDKKKKQPLHLLRIGIMSKGSPKDFKDQKDGKGDFIKSPRPVEKPLHRRINAMRSDFQHTIRPFVMDSLVDVNELFKAASKQYDVCCGDGNLDLTTGRA